MPIYVGLYPYVAQLVEQGTENARVSCSTQLVGTIYGWVAQLVEHWSEKPSVGGSIPPPAAIF